DNGPAQGGEENLSPPPHWKQSLVIKPRGAPSAIYCVAVSPDGKTVASGEADGVRLLSAQTGKEQARLTPQAQPAKSVAFSPDGKFLAVGRLGGFLEIWDVKTAKVRVDLKGQPSGVFSVAFSPDGKLLASAAGT